ncbi:AAEL001547-PA [Aedes aegypti]|uniref:AAEL001547-PA n=1 Tax=Aedes aegypti TaxID=7159 RepID=Q17KT4_AEDAE|nr:AAEL001547-PA [Aedes aegypti]
MQVSKLNKSSLKSYLTNGADMLSDISRSLHQGPTRGLKRHSICMNQGQEALVTVVTIFVSNCEDSGTAGIADVLTTQTVDFAVFVDLLVLKTVSLTLCLIFFRWSNSSSCAPCHHRGGAAPSVEWTPSGCCSQSAAIFRLLADEDETLLIWRDCPPGLGFGLDILERIGRFDIKVAGLARQGLNEHLHPRCLTLTPPNVWERRRILSGTSWVGC